MTITERLSEFSRATRYEDLPAEVIEKAKLLVLDTVGVAIGSTALSFGQDALRLRTSGHRQRERALFAPRPACHRTMRRWSMGS